MSKKEIDRVLRLVKQNKEPNIVVKCELENAADLATLLEHVARDASDTVVLLVSAAEATNGSAVATATSTRPTKPAIRSSRGVPAGCTSWRCSG